MSIVANGRSMLASDRIKPGTILIREGAQLPESLGFDSEPCPIGWRLVKNLDGYGLNRKICNLGWTFLDTANVVQARVFGFDAQKALRRAVGRVLATLESEPFNCLEISRVAVKHFLGLPYVTVSAHPRHIQQSTSLPGTKRHAVWSPTELLTASTHT